jgi:hypothetical protein
MMFKCDPFSEYKRAFVSVQTEGIMSEERDDEAVVKSFRVFGT